MHEMSYCICSVKIDVIIFQNLVDNAARFEYNVTQMSPIKGSSLRASFHYVCALPISSYRRARAPPVSA